MCFYLLKCELKDNLDVRFYNLENKKFLKKSFNVYFHSKELVDEENKIRDISDISAGGKTSYELKINSKNDLDNFLNLFKQVYNQKKE